MLTWRDIREMHRWGITFGAHTLTHPDLPRLSLDRAKAETCDSKAVIEDTLGAPVTCFAYPYGRYNRCSRELAQQHFACAVPIDSVLFQLPVTRMLSSVWTRITFERKSCLT